LTGENRQIRDEKMEEGRVFVFATGDVSGHMTQAEREEMDTSHKENLRRLEEVGVTDVYCDAAGDLWVWPEDKEKAEQVEFLISGSLL